MKGWLIRAMVVMLVLAVVVPACAPAKPKPEKIVNLELFTTGAAGTPPYIMAVNLAEMLNELHPWLRGSVVESLATLDAIHSSGELPAERKKNAILSIVTDITYADAAAGVAPFKRKYPDLRFIGLTNEAGFGLATYDPRIKSPQDIIGKRIALTTKGALLTIMMEAVLRDAWGIIDQVKISHHSPMDFKDLLVTGVADVTLSNANTAAGGKWGDFNTSPWVMMTLAARPAYWIDISQEDVDKVNKANIWKASRFLLPKGALGKNDPPEDVGLLGTMSYFFTWDTADEEVIYELVKFLVENAEEWSERNRGSPRTTLEYLARGPMYTEGNVHPGALRYYKEHGIKIGG